MAARSPFKLLNAYELEDREIFFGRDDETDDLERISYQSNLILVYGQSGTGKTSLIKCGLASRFSPTDWFHIYVRRGENINESLLQRLNEHQSVKTEEDEDLFELFSSIKTKGDVAATQTGSDSAIIHALKSIYGTFLRPIYLLFDQFEELFTLGDEDEQTAFYGNVAEILREAPFCKLIFIMREEYLARLSAFEKAVKSLFDHRLRIELMSRKKVNEVIVRTADKLNIKLEDDQVPETIIENTIDKRSHGRVQLPYLQVYLDRLWQAANERTDNGIIFDMQLLTDMRIADVLSSFLEERLEMFEKEVAKKNDGIRFLKAFVTKAGTKEPRRKSDLYDSLPSLMPGTIDDCLAFFTEQRVLNPGENERYELAHDSLADKIISIEIVKRVFPEIPDVLTTPENPFAGFGSYTPEMARVFFGRLPEAQELFDKIANAPDEHITLLFGPTGSGKTSLINAGLIPRVKDYYDIFYQRISKAYVDKMEKLHLKNPSKTYTGEWSSYVLDQLMQNNVDTDKPDLIILDQFEEFFIWAHKPMLKAIVNDLKQLVEQSRYGQILIVVRSEHFAKILELDQQIPKLLDNRLRLDPVDEERTRKIIRDIGNHLAMEIKEEAIREIIEKSKVEDTIDLGFVQMYLRELHKTKTS